MTQEHYVICDSILSFDVEQQVNKLMNEGWKPLGNLIVAMQRDPVDEQEHLHFIQAMIKDSLMEQQES